MSDRVWKDGDRARIRVDLAPGYTQPYAGLIRQGRYGTLHVYSRPGMRGPETLHDLTFDVLRVGATPHKLGVRPQDLEAHAND